MPSVVSHDIQSEYTCDKKGASSPYDLFYNYIHLTRETLDTYNFRLPIPQRPPTPTPLTLDQPMGVIEGWLVNQLNKSIKKEVEVNKSMHRVFIGKLQTMDGEVRFDALGIANEERTGTAFCPLTKPFFRVRWNEYQSAITSDYDNVVGYVSDLASLPSGMVIGGPTSENPNGYFTVRGPDIENPEVPIFNQRYLSYEISNFLRFRKKSDNEFYTGFSIRYIKRVNTNYSDYPDLGDIPIPTFISWIRGSSLLTAGDRVSGSFLVTPTVGIPPFRNSYSNFFHTLGSLRLGTIDDNPDPALRNIFNTRREGRESIWGAGFRISSDERAVFVTLTGVAYQENRSSFEVDDVDFMIVSRILRKKLESFPIFSVSEEAVPDIPIVAPSSVITISRDTINPHSGGTIGFRTPRIEDVLSRSDNIVREDLGFAGAPRFPLNNLHHLTSNVGITNPVRGYNTKFRFLIRAGKEGFLYGINPAAELSFMRSIVRADMVSSPDVSREDFYTFTAGFEKQRIPLRRLICNNYCLLEPADKNFTLPRLNRDTSITDTAGNSYTQVALQYTIRLFPIITPGSSPEDYPSGGMLENRSYVIYRYPGARRVNALDTVSLPDEPILGLTTTRVLPPIRVPVSNLTENPNNAIGFRFTINLNVPARGYPQYSIYYRPRAYPQEPSIGGFPFQFVPEEVDVAELSTSDRIFGSVRFTDVAVTNGAYEFFVAII